MKRPSLDSLRTLTDDPRRLRWLLLAIIPLLAIPAWWPLTNAGFPKTHDASVHLMRLFLIDQQIASGNPFPRWLPELFLGYGYPVLDFYAPVIYYAAKLLSFWRLDFLQAYGMLIGVSIVVAGWGMYLLAASLYADARDRRGEWAGLAAAVAYMYTPYFLVNIYVRGALAEMVAQALLPFAFWSTYRLLTGSRPLRYAALTAATITLLALTHNITLLFLPSLLITFVLVIVWQQHRKGQLRWDRLLWFVGAGVVAMVASAFFWLPVLLERRFLGPSTFDMGKELSIHVWTWRTFLESRWPYDHQRTGIPFRLGLVQVILGLIGLVLTRRRGPLWWYWVVWGAICIVLVLPLAMPVWSASAYLQLAQFPWRLLTIISLSIALVTGGIVTAANQKWLQVLSTAIIAGVMIMGNLPHREAYNGSAYEDIEVNSAVIARYESVRGAYGAGWHREFLPLWSQAFDEENIQWPTDVASALRVTLDAIGPTAITLHTSSPVTSTLRLNQFYFPGWTAELDGSQPLAVGPSTPRGVVTAVIPGGEHTVQFAWSESTVQRVAEWITIGGLIGLAILLWLRRARWLSVGVLAAGLLAAAILLPTPSEATDSFVARNVAVTPGLQLLGYRTEQSAGGRHLLVTPYWYVSQPLAPMKLRWSLLDEDGQPVGSTDSTAYYDSLSFSTLAPGSVVRDGYRIELPSSQPATAYTLQVQPLDGAEESIPATALGSVRVGPTRDSMPLHLLLTEPEIGDQAWLDGYELSINGTPITGTVAGVGQTVPVVRPGDTIEYILYWRADITMTQDYHSFMHLVDTQRLTLVSQDKVPGTEISRPILWDRYHTERDTYTLRSPASAIGGLYYPRIGLYNYGNLDRFLIRSQDGVEIGDGFDLPPIKILSSTSARPKTKLQARYGDFAELLGYDLTLPGPTVQPGDSLTLTVYYRSVGATAVDYTQFFQLYDPALGMAAQLDQPPLAGGNPTSTWIPGEVVADRVVLQVKPDAAPGVYTLNTGLYDPTDSGARVGVTKVDGAGFPDNQVPLVQVQIDAGQQ